jgi:hypothetical protein
VTTPPVVAVDVAARRAAWLTALRSGAYVQARGALRIGDGYCCLGVAEDVRGATWYALNTDERNGVDHVGTHAVQLGDEVGDVAYTEGTQLTAAGAAWLGLASPNPFVAVRVAAEDYEDDFDWDLGAEQPVRWRARTLADLNDGGWSLAEVADAIADQPADWTGGQDPARGLAATRNEEAS